MKALFKIPLSILIFMFTVLFIGQDTVKGAIYEKAKIENSSNNSGTQSGSNSESSNDEEVSFLLQTHDDPIIADECQNLALQTFGLPPAVCYPIWLPPDNS